MSIKVTRLTALNIDALKQCYPTASNGRQMMKLTGTTAEFYGHKELVLAQIDNALIKATAYGVKGHPYQSLHAVRRKVVSA